MTEGSLPVDATSELNHRSKVSIFQRAILIFMYSILVFLKYFLESHSNLFVFYNSFLVSIFQRAILIFTYSIVVY